MMRLNTCIILQTVQDLDRDARLLKIDMLYGRFQGMILVQYFHLCELEVNQIHP